MSNELEKAAGQAMYRLECLRDEINTAYILFTHPKFEGTATEKR